MNDKNEVTTNFDEMMPLNNCIDKQGSVLIDEASENNIEESNEIRDVETENANKLVDFQSDNLLSLSPSSPETSPAFSIIEDELRLLDQEDHLPRPQPDRENAEQFSKFENQKYDATAAAGDDDEANNAFSNLNQTSSLDDYMDEINEHLNRMRELISGIVQDDMYEEFSNKSNEVENQAEEPKNEKHENEKEEEIKVKEDCKLQSVMNGESVVVDNLLRQEESQIVGEVEKQWSTICAYHSIDKDVDPVVVWVACADKCEEDGATSVDTNANQAANIAETIQNISFLSC